MKILAVMGNHLRHLYYFNEISKVFSLAGAIIVNREEIIPQPPEKLAEIDRNNFIKHFRNRYLTERKYFKKQSLPDCSSMVLKPEQLNSDKSVSFLTKIRPDLVFVFGTSLIKEPLFSHLPSNTINLHLGLSPRYRGAATLFWPFYFLEPAYAGATFHFIVGEPDAGDIVHQVVPKLRKTDHIHDVACKTVIVSTQAAIKLLLLFKQKGYWKRYKQRSTGKNFLTKDFKPEHLRVIYNLFNDDIVSSFLDGKISGKVPQLIRQF